MSDFGQTVINPEGQPIGRAGQLADNRAADVGSGFNSDTTAIPFGVAIKVDATDASGRSVKNLSSINDAVDSVTILSMNHQVGTTGDLDANGAVVPTGQIDRLWEGRVLVQVEEAVNPGDRAWVRAVADAPLSLNTIGAFRKSQDAIAGPTNTCIDITRSAVYRTGAAAGGLAWVDVEFTVKVG